MEDAIKLQSEPPVPAVYQLKLTEIGCDKVKKIREYRVGPHSQTEVLQEKVVLVMGKTCAGKTTLINGLVNYMLGVKFEDPVRFKLVLEEESDYVHFELSNTKTRRLPLSLLGIDRIDAVGLAMPSSTIWMDATQKYRLSTVMSVFEKDISENLFLLLTFADYKTPVALINGVQEELGIKFAGFCKFNNCVLYEPNDHTADVFTRRYWNIGPRAWRISSPYWFKPSHKAWPLREKYSKKESECKYVWMECLNAMTIHLTEWRPSICPKKCEWTHHSNTPYVYVYTKKKDKKVLEDLLKAHNNFKTESEQLKALLSKTRQEYEALGKEQARNVEELKQAFDKLDRIAVLRNKSSVIEY
ncbi:hypothetical protein RvY_12042 [Ramazzottius varieornatus]|uniref:G domain-containing protein n=1 Tax=Ramazzottius varieornatus TaxID=947166 RepID=A0A1D1VNJ1_RAMVA|nr:hypothetical protein RvY_12042 [Ramazzottius varieornatus]